MSIGPEFGDFCLARRETTPDSRAIEAGLHELWRLAEAGEIGGSLIRSASLTLLVPVPVGQADDLIATIDRVTLTHPCRAIIVALDDAAREPSAILASHYRRA